jgi:hypothetical protein
MAEMHKMWDILQDFRFEFELLIRFVVRYWVNVLLETHGSKLIASFAETAFDQSESVPVRILH